MSLSLATAPEAGDHLFLVVSTRAVTVTLLTPDGRRSTRKDNGVGLVWSESRTTPAIGSTDTAVITAIEFTEDKPSGDYVFELSAAAGSPAATAQVRFQSERASYAASVEKMQGFVKAGPIDAGRDGDSMFLEGPEKTGSLLDIVVADAQAVVSVSLPDGRKVSSDRPAPKGLDWRRVEDRRRLTSDMLLGMGEGSFLLRERGPHHVLSLGGLPRGRYDVHVDRATHLTAAIIPVESAMMSALEGIRQLTEPVRGQARLEAYGLPYDFYVGDQIPIHVRVRGEPLAPGVKFNVLLEYKDVIRMLPDDEFEYTKPVVERAPVTMTASPDGHWHWVVIPRHEGLLRVGITARGKLLSGQPFADSAETHTTVHRLVARFISIEARAIDTDGNGLLDRLDVLAHLDVVVPGRYAIEFDLRNPAGLGSLHSGEAALGTGNQTLTVSLPAAALRFRQMPLARTIGGIQIYRPKGSTFGDSVRVTHDLTVPLPAEPPERWEP